MEAGETRDLEINKDSKQNCRLPVVDDKIKIKIKKEEKDKNQFLFELVETEGDAYIHL